MENPTSSTLDDKALLTLTCCSCSLYLNVLPILTFEDETSICGRCYKPENYSNDGRPVQNKIYELMSKYVPFPCKFRRAGCNERRAGDTLNVHENSCLFRSCNCPVSDCDWDGVMQSLQQHYETHHPSLCVVGCKISFDISRDYEESKFVVDSEMKFIVQVKCDITSKKFYCAAVCVSSSGYSASHQLQLKFEHSVCSIIYKIQATNNILPIDNDETLQIDIDVLQKLINTQNLEAQISFRTPENNQVVIEPSLLNEFECPICNHYMVPPIFLCLNGHSICNSCKIQVDNCPICRVKLNKVHNFALEAIVEQMIYPCKYLINGCRYILPANEIVAHESTCVLHRDTQPQE